MRSHGSKLLELLQVSPFSLGVTRLVLKFTQWGGKVQWVLDYINVQALQNFK